LQKVLRKKVIKKKIQNIKKLNTKKLSGIFHLAAQASVPLSLKQFYNSTSNNLLSSMKVFELAKQYSVPVVYASSSAIYGNLPLGSDNIEKFSILSPYAQDKLTMENYAKMAHDIFKTSSVGLRLFNVYGPRQNSQSSYSAVVPIFIYRMLKNLPITINGGFQTRDFVYVDDVVKIMRKSMEKIQKKTICQNFNLGTGRSIRIDILFDLVRNKIGANPKIIRKKLEKHDPKKSSGTFQQLNKFLNINKEYFTKIEDGLDMAINHLRGV
jgi:UDP-glucose 4-epimerase